MFRGYFYLLRLMSTPLVLRPLISHLNSRGVPVFVWVLNDAQAFERARDLGANGIMTDDVRALRDFLKA